MSIEITGPLKYRFQDQVCALLAVVASSDSSATLRVEPKDGEDAVLTYVGETGNQVLEVQIKGAAGQVTREVMADWLAHFPSGSHESPLLERVHTQQNSVLFIATGRCDDSTSVHRVPISVSLGEHKRGTIKTAHSSQMRIALRSYASSVSQVVNGEKKPSLDLLRRQSIASFEKRTPTRGLTTLLHRVFVVEQLDESKAVAEIGQSLRESHGVVPDMVDRIRCQILDVIVRQKRSGNDVLPEIRQVILAARAVDPINISSYVARGEEDHLACLISENSALLLTGAPRVGKSVCARNLVSVLRNMGYRAKVCVDASDADRFLSDPVSESRVALLDDPLGGSHSVDSPARELDIISGLIMRLGNGRRLVVSQAQDRLLETTRKADVGDVSTGNLRWVVMGTGDSGYLLKLWNSLSKTYKVSDPIRTEIGERLRAGTLHLESGCLVYLAANHARLVPNASIDDAISFARQDARALGAALRCDDLATISIALAITSTPSLWVANSELGYVLNEAVGDSIDTGSSAPGVVPVANAPEFSISRQRLDDLEALELRRIISEQTGSYTFSHPLYRAGAESLVDSATRRSADEALAILARALTSRSPTTTRAAAINLSWIHRNMDKVDARRRIVDLAATGLNTSPFPVVADVCFTFLASVVDSMDMSDQGRLTAWASRASTRQLHDFDASGPELLMPSTSDVGYTEFSAFAPGIDREKVDGVMACLNGRDHFVLSASQEVGVALYLAQNAGEINHQIAGRLLSLDASVIRASVARTWLTMPRADDSKLLDRIFADVQPAVVRAAYDGVVGAWPECDDDRRESLLTRLTEMADSPVSSSILIGPLVLIHRREYGGRETPWKIFERLMPVVLKHLPVGTVVRDARLYNVVEIAIGKISEVALSEIIDHWINYLQKLVQVSRLSDYMLGVSEILVRGLSKDSNERNGRVEALLALKGTATRARVVSDLVGLWDDLSARERQSLLRTISDGATDQVWLQAFALTRPRVPEEIVKVVLGHVMGMAAVAGGLRQVLPSKLLSACIQVYSRVHPTIAEVRSSVEEDCAWSDLIRDTVLKPCHPLFEDSWEWILRHESEYAAQVVSTLGVDHASRLAALLLARKQRTSGEFMPAAWVALFDLPVGSHVRSGWVKRMAELAPSVLHTLGEHADWVPESYRLEFLKHFEADLDWRKLIHTLKGVLRTTQDRSGEQAGEVEESVSIIIERMLEENPPLHPHTLELIEQFLNYYLTSNDSLREKVRCRHLHAAELAHRAEVELVNRLESWDEPALDSKNFFS